ncbi:MAG TPA: efflux RND transporter periplasmic adaptor subunit [Candidatus Acidoferrales bacterium]|nr:efflux RND transporter periplasmic adaptor subunit [Candidatus Acidoferrales bacterium]
MEILLLGIYGFFAWLIFFKFKWLPWNITTQVITITLPILGLSALILLLNIAAPSSHDIRVINYVVPINPQVRGLVIEVPIEPNRPIKKGDVLFKLDPTPYAIAVTNGEANVLSLREQLRSTQAGNEVTATRLALARKRLGQFTELAGAGAGSKFDQEQAEADVLGLESQLDASSANEDMIRAQIASAEAQLADARWQLSQTTYYAPADGTVVALTLRPGAMAVPVPVAPAMNFIEDEQWILAIYQQNEVRKIKPGQEAEVAFKMYPGRIVKCKVDSIMWATAQGQLPIGTMNLAGGVAPVPPNCLAVRLVPDGRDKDIFLAAGAHGAGAVYTDSCEPIHILRKILVRVSAKLDWFILKLH